MFTLSDLTLVTPVVLLNTLLLVGEALVGGRVTAGVDGGLGPGAAAAYRYHLVSFHRKWGRGTFQFRGQYHQLYPQPQEFVPPSWWWCNALLLCSVPHRNCQRIARIFAPIHATRASTLPQQSQSNYVYFAISFTFIRKYTFILSLTYNSLTCFVSLYLTLKIYFCQMDFKTLSWSIIYWFYFHFLREYFLPSWYHHFHSFVYFIYI